MSDRAQRLKNVVVILVLSCGGVGLGCKTPQEAGPTKVVVASSQSAVSSEGVVPVVSATPSAPESGAASPDPVPDSAAEPLPAVPQEPSPPEPLPAVAVKNIGMHIGGGPNDQVSKQPIADSVKPHFDALRACWRLAEDPSKQGDFGVDLLIAHQGGKAQVSHPRTSIKGEGFKECVVGVFEQIDFLKPKTGTTMVSYSVRFTP